MAADEQRFARSLSGEKAGKVRNGSIGNPRTVKILPFRCLGEQ